MLRSAYGKGAGCRAGITTVPFRQTVKLCLLILVSFSFQSFFTSESQVVSLSFKEAPLQKVFTEIRRQTGYSFAYYETDLVKAKTVTINITNTRIQDALSMLFENQPLTYTIIEKVVVVKQKAAEKKIALEQSSLSVLPAFDVRGRVLNDQGDPVAGVTVQVKGTKTGTSTDGDGEFSLKNIDANAILIFTAVNIEATETPVNGRRTLDIRVKGKTGKLDEVQVIAYGKTSQRYSVGNVAIVKAEDIEKQPVTNPLLALQGRVPGLLVTQNTGIANGAFTVQIQGPNSIGSGNNPLIVVDGVPLAFDLFGANNLSGPLEAGTGRFGNSPINFINPSDIESIAILKDADATAIYGSRAASGAILITTKKGMPGKTKLTLGVQQGWGKVARQVNMLDTRQYLDMRYEAIKNEGVSVTTRPNEDLRLWDTTRYTDWQKELIGGTAKYTNITASISGGTGTVQYLVGGTLNRSSTVFPGDFVSKTGNIHFNINASSPDQRFKLSLTGSYAVNSNAVPGIDLTKDALFLAPDAPSLYNEDGTLNWAPNAAGSSTFFNPLAQTAFSNYEHNINTLTSNAIVSYSILPGLTIKSSFGYNNLRGNTFWARSVKATSPERRDNTGRLSGFNNMNSFTWIAEPQLTFTKTIGKISLDALIGGTFQKNKGEYNAISASGFVNDLLLRDIASATSLTGYYNNNIYKYNALFGRLNIVFDKKYILNLTARRDGSSRFGANNRFNNFWSAGGGWIFTEEKVFRKTLKFLSFGKIRANYGITGNDQIGDYQYLNTYFTPTSSGIPYQNIAGLTTNALSNPYLQWEETRKMQGGIDLGLFRDRVLLNATYVYNRSSNQLLFYVLPSITGVNGLTQNFPATVQNTSWEFSITTNPIKTKQFTWNCNVNLTIPRNKLINFPDIDNTPYANPESGVIIGQPLGVRPYYHYLGVDPGSGNYLLANENKQPVFGFGPQVGGRNHFISKQPEFYGGIVNTLSYKGFSLDFLFQFVRQQGAKSLYFSNDLTLPGIFANMYSNQPVTVLNRWQKPGDASLIQKFSSGPGALLVTQTDAYFSYDASFVRLKNLSLSWRIPDNWLKTTHLQNGSLYFSGQNLATISRYTGLDPETQSSITLPPLQMWTIGFTVVL